RCSTRLVRTTCHSVPSLRHCPIYFRILFFSSHPATTQIHTLSLHDALPILEYSSSFSRYFAVRIAEIPAKRVPDIAPSQVFPGRSEEHTSELQSRFDLVCRLLLEKKK